MESYVGVYHWQQQLEPRALKDETRPAPTVLVAESRPELRTFVDPSQNQLLPDLCPLALCPHLYVADFNLPCIKMTWVGISLSPMKWTSITCGLVFNLSSFGKFPTTQFCSWEWLAASLAPGAWANHPCPLQLSQRRVHHLIWASELWADIFWNSWKEMLSVYHWIWLCEAWSCRRHFVSGGRPVRGWR